jgi:subtilisin family serine protease
MVQPVWANTPFRAEIDPRIWQDLATASTTSVLVRIQTLSPSTDSLPSLSSSDSSQDPISIKLRQQIYTTAQSQHNLRAELDAAGQPYRSYWIVNLIVLTADRAELERLASRSDVLYIEPNRPFAVPLEQFTAGNEVLAAPAAIQPGLTQVHAPDLWALGIKGDGIVVASADTGVKWDHPALQAHYRGWDGITANHNYNWWDAVHAKINPSINPNPCGGYSLSVPCDDYGHGTHTTGTMIGRDGDANQIGMAPNAQWIACRNMDNGWGTPATYIECLEFFIAPYDLTQLNPDPTKRPHIIDNSYGCPSQEGCQSNSLHDAVLAVYDAGIFMSVSAGNSGPGCATITDPPGLEPFVFTVGGVNFSSQMYTSSSRGPVTVNSIPYIKPDVVAPGVNVISSTRTGYGTMTGTSMAAPHVAGGVALLWSAFPNLKRDLLSTKALLHLTAAPISPGATPQTCGGTPETVTPNNTSGWGQLDILAAYNRWFANPSVLPTYYFPIYYK